MAHVVRGEGPACGRDEGIDLPLRGDDQRRIREGNRGGEAHHHGWVDNGRAQWFIELADQLVQKVVPHRAGAHVKTTVIWDVYASHRSEETKAKVADLGIDLRFIPAGETDAVQPLDQAIFGELKSRARALAVAESAKLGKTQVKATDALRHFLTAWEAIEA
jgi:hypothetical protein